MVGAFFVSVRLLKIRFFDITEYNVQRYHRFCQGLDVGLYEAKSNNYGAIPFEGCVATEFSCHQITLLI